MEALATYHWVNTVCTRLWSKKPKQFAYPNNPFQIFSCEGVLPVIHAVWLEVLSLQWVLCSLSTLVHCLNDSPHANCLVCVLSSLCTSCVSCPPWMLTLPSTLWSAPYKLLPLPAAIPNTERTEGGEQRACQKQEQRFHWFFWSYWGKSTR